VAKGLGATPTAPAFLGRGDPQAPAQIRDAAFAAPAPAAGKPVYQAIAMDEGGAALMAVLTVKPGAAGGNAASDQQLMAGYSQRHREADLQAYLAELQRTAKIRRNPAVFN
jgi:hypothetical protein